MKITDMKCCLVEVPFGKSGLRTARTKPPGLVQRSERFCLVRIYTDEKIVGIGAQDVDDLGWCDNVERIVKPVLMKQIVEPYYVEKFANYLRAPSFGTGLNPRPCCVELALWDLIGKKADLPVYKVLGACQDRVKAYASVLEPYPIMSPQKWTEYIRRIDKEGFQAVKLHIGWLWPKPDKILEVVRSVRKRLGYELGIMIDTTQAWTPNPKYDLETAIRLARGLEEYGALWLEEPLPHLNNPEVSARLCDAVDIPIAGGGAMFGYQKFRTVLEKGALDIVQPDVTHGGGILEVKRIAFLAENYGKVCSPHYWGYGVGLAATLQLLGSTNIPWLEYPHHPPAFTYQIRDSMLTAPIVIDKEGYVDIPKQPGIGVALNEQFIRKHTITN
jgi:L-alanine-DL-glutamate epimerase-like enolase superfamily enzyme